MFGFSFFATAASVIAGGAIATATVVGVVNNSVETPGANVGNVSQATTPVYGSTR